jgi:capsular polysaccharide biosynthesis protein
VLQQGETSSTHVEFYNRWWVDKYTGLKTEQGHAAYSSDRILSKLCGATYMQVNETKMMETNSSNSSSSMESSLKYFADDEISLMDLWNVLSKRKGLIFLILLASVITAGLLIFFTPPVYESRAVAQIGKIGKIGQIEPVATLVKRLLEQYGVHELNDKQVVDDKTLTYIQTVSVEKDTNLISITMRGPTPKAAQNYLAQVLDKLMKEHRQFFDYAQKEQQQYLSLMQMRLHEISQTIDALDKGLRTVALKDLILRANLALEKSKLFEHRTVLEQKQMELRMAMSEFESKPTVLIKAPTLTSGPVRPRPLLYFVLAIGIGFMLGILSAFAVEFISKAQSSASS